MAAEDTIRDDIAYMRGLAEAGRKGPVLGGSIMLACGLIYSVAAVFSWAIHSGRLAAPSSIPGMEWWIAGAVQAVAMAILIPALRRRPQAAGSTVSRLFGVVWSSCGYSIFAIFIATGLLNREFHSDAVWTTIPVAILTLYGAGWSISAALVKRRWMYGVAAFSYLAAISTAFMIKDASGMLGYGAVIFLVIAVPGALLMREAALPVESAA